MSLQLASHCRLENIYLLGAIKHAQKFHEYYVPQRIQTRTAETFKKICIGPRTAAPKRTLTAGWVFPPLYNPRDAAAVALATGQTDGQTDTRSMLYAFCYGRGHSV